MKRHYLKQSLRMAFLVLAAAVLGQTAWGQTQSAPIILPASVPNGTFTAHRSGVQLNNGDIVTVGDIIDFIAVPDEGYQQTAGTFTGSHIVNSIDVTGDKDVTPEVNAPGWTPVTESNPYENIRTSGYKINLHREDRGEKIVEYQMTETGEFTLSWDWAINQGYIQYGAFTMKLIHNGTTVVTENLNSDNVNGYDQIRRANYSFTGTGEDTFLWVFKRESNNWADDGGRWALLDSIVFSSPGQEGAGYTPPVPVFSKIHKVTVAEVEHGQVIADPTEGVEGTPILLTSIPDLGYALSDITAVAGTESVTVTKYDSYRYIMEIPDADVTVTPVFTECRGAIVLPESIDNGTMMVERNGAALNNGDIVAAGETLKFTVTPDEGCIQTAGIESGEVTLEPKHFDVQDGNFTYKPQVPVFAHTWAITVVNGDGYEITPSATTSIAGETIELTFTPSTDNYIKSITAVRTDDETPVTLTVSSSNSKIYSFTMPEGDVTVSGTIYKAPDKVNDYYQLGTAEDLLWFSTHVITGDNTKFNAELINDIDYTAHNQPLSRNLHTFSGHFEGRGHTITINLRADEDYYGLFGKLSKGATLSDLHVTGNLDASTKYHDVGGIVGIVSNTGGAIIENCVSTVNIKAGKNRENIGGIVGNVWYDCTIRNCLWAGTITGGNSNVGGIFGGVTNEGVSSVYNNLSIGRGIDQSVRYKAIGAYVNYLKSCSNNYSNIEGDGTTPVTAAQLASGEVAWLLNDSSAYAPRWYQTLGSEDGYPMPWGEDVVVKITGNGIDTFYGEENKYALKDDVEAYIVTSVTSDKAYAKRVAEIPATMPVVLKAPEAGYFNLAVANNETAEGVAPYYADADNDVNLLVGASKAMTGSDLYAIAEQNEKPGFALQSGTVPVGRAYLQLNDGGESFRELVFDDVISGVTDINVNTGDGTTYNVMGQRVDESYRGVVIRNGKKYIQR